MNKGWMLVVNNLHYNFIMTGSLSEKHTLFAEECFTNLFDCFETFLNISGIRNTRVSVYQSKKAKHGKIRWDKQELLRIVTDNELTPLMLVIEAPSIKSSYNKGTTPEVYILLSNDPMGQSPNNCGMLVSIRQDIYERIDQTIVEDVMMQLSQWIKATKLLHSSRNFYAGSKARAIMDILPFMLEKDTPDMKYVFQSWTPYPLPHT
ncbi:hypothetical protein G9G63_02850 [Paenibacillus sp. EKM202P]|uniref:hypothetical protein n=1 Tax=Paenibacillus TaxID=44249 RepID=UPI000589F1D1|nr:MULTISPECIES: hypothetical protein [Paenibacillus]AJE52036.1 hypothetical protein RE92_13735 [Paenibacillus polymyxa]KAF6567567.1 hypothetical protein G9G63_02850 [Paenibacillus sp. EKM202P]KAF6573319.1 hypothetical protein G9G64_01110 [Paenibacillus sp. EKM207P]MEE4567460.1 hypothetical protein [Paenibacillus polymyxa]QOH64149.1 hypothetical protein DI243_23335 [Paenibacillus polymyxa]